MWRGLYTAGAGMITETKRTDTIANNLANANTSGYKRDNAINEEFEPMLIKRIGDYAAGFDVTRFKNFHVSAEEPPTVGTLGLGSKIAEIATDHAQGVFETTGNPLDLAISGNGYFVIQTPQGERYTRDGNFYLGANGQIRTVQGFNVLGEGGPITIPEGTRAITVGATGQVLADGQEVGQLRFVEFNDRRAVLKQGGNLFYAQQGAQPQQATGEINQGLLERSNTNVVSEMVNLIANHRVYEAGSKAVTTQDAMLEVSVNQVGRSQ